MEARGRSLGADEGELPMQWALLGTPGKGSPINLLLDLPRKAESQ